MRKSKIICIDIETTGLDRNNDEILQVSIINGRGKTLYNSYIKPRTTRRNGKRRRQSIKYLGIA